MVCAILNGRKVKYGVSASLLSVSCFMATVIQFIIEVSNGSTHIRKMG